MLKSTPRAGSTIVDYYRAGSAGSRLRPADLDRVNVASYDLAPRDGDHDWRLSDRPRDRGHRRRARAEGAGVAVSFDVNHRIAALVGRGGGAALAWVAAHADILIAGDDEARILLGGAADPDDLALPAGRARALGGDREAGCRRGGGRPQRRSWSEVDAVAVQAVDTVGAGDAFTAAYLAERLAGCRPADPMTTAAIARRARLHASR